MTLIADLPGPPIPAHPSPIIRAALQWRSPERDLWVAQTDRGDFAGLVERIDTQYLPTTGTGHQLGAFPTLAEAEAAIAVSRGLRRLERDRTHVLTLIASISEATALITAIAGIAAMIIVASARGRR